MIRECLTEQRRSLDNFAVGLTDLARGSASCCADAAAIRLAEVIDMHEQWLRAQFKE